MTNQPKKIACIIGTRPEVIKMAPIILTLQKNPAFEVTVINTAQHRKLLDDMLSIFNIELHIDLNLMQANQSLITLTTRLLEAMKPLFLQRQFDLIIAQGDTTTTFVTALVAFYHQIPFMHVEAGLRSFDLSHPFPEEGNRALVTKIARLHCAPSRIEAEILQKENVPAHHILTCGNTVIDALFMLAEKNAPLPFPTNNKRILLVTLHRRESFGEPMMCIFNALLELAKRFPDILIIYPVHPNPNVRIAAYNALNNVANIRLIEPLPYDVFVTLMKESYLLLTDSGGMQEEAPALNKPVLILRKVTERPLVVREGLGVLVGSDTQKIIATASRLLMDPEAYHAMQKGISPYGDGQAARRIVDFVKQFFKIDQTEQYCLDKAAF